MPTNQQYSQDEIKQMVDDMMKDFDLTKLQAIGYDNIQKLADEYIKSEDPETHAFGQELRNIDPSIFELSPAEERLKQVHAEIMNKGKSKADADMVGIQILETAVESVTQDIVGAMNDKSYQEWEALQSHEPNIFQTMYLLDQTAQMLLKKTYDELYEEALNKAIDILVDLLQNTEESYNEIKDISEEDAKAIMTAFNANQYEIAIQLIYESAKKDGK